MARHRAEPDGPLDETRPPDHGRLSPLVVVVVVAALCVFVAGAVWAVTSPSHGTGTAPQSAPAGAVPALSGDPSTGTPEPAATSSSPHRPTPAASTSTGARPVPTSSPPAAPVAVLTAKVAMDTWQPNNVLFAVSVSAGATGTSGWLATLRCTAPADGWQLSVGNMWGATLVSSTATSVTVKPLDWNAAIAPGKAATFGFVGTWGPTDQPAGGTPACIAVASPA